MGFLSGDVFNLAAQLSVSEPAGKPVSADVQPPGPGPEEESLEQI